MSQENVELVLRGYHAFVDGDLAQAEQLLDDDIEWHGSAGEPWPADLAGVQEDRPAESHHRLVAGNHARDDLAPG